MILKYIFHAGCCLLLAMAAVSAEDERPVEDATKVPVETVANAALPTLHIVGDSTVRSGGKNGMWGWGERIAPFFDAKKINVVNHAIGGRSSRTFFTEGRWDQMMEKVKRGDIVLIQFGHNDQGRIGDPANKGRASGKGTGDETVEDTRPDGTKEQVHTFGWYMGRYVNDARAKGATVVVLSPIPHKDRWEKDRDFVDIAKWDAEVAKAGGAQFIDLTLLVTEGYKSEGAAKVESFFADKGTHTTDEGARFNAARVVQGLESLPEQPVSAYLTSRTGAAAPAAQPGGMRFSFGAKALAKAPAAGWRQVTAESIYSPERGHGYEAAPVEGKPFLFSVKLPEGNYLVTVVLNDRDSVTTVKSEQRRLMLERVVGADSERKFIVNTRTSRLPSGNSVGLKPREIAEETINWDDKLTLEFNGTKPVVKSLTITPANVPTIFITGDSTVCDQAAEPWNSWGQMLPRFFKPVLAVANHAQSGESIKSSLSARRFEKVFSQMKSADYLFIQFGHNDQKDKRPGALDDYRKNLTELVRKTRSLGATPVLITSMERKGGLEKDTLEAYPDTVKAVAIEEKCALIDLHAMSRVFYQALGPDLDKAFQDGTHHNNYGSYELAKCVVLGIQQAKLPLAGAITPDFGKFDPARPDPVSEFEMPASPVVSELKPAGN